MSETNCKVVTISVDAVVNGHKLDVSEFTLSLGVNAIPKIELVCAPSQGGTATKLKPYVSSPTLKDYSKLYQDLSADAEGLDKTGTISISILARDEKADTIELKNWILSDVGMSSISATAAPHLVVILQHRICKLTKFGSIYETPRSNLQKTIADVVSGGNFTSIIKKVYDTVAKDSNVLYYKVPNTAPSRWRGKLGENEFQPGEYLVDTSNKPFPFLVDPSEERRMAQAIAMTVIPIADGSSTWDMLLRSAGMLLLSVVQDSNNNYTQGKLVLEPTEPWKRKTITLSGDRSFSTDVFGYDPFKIAGVMARKLGPGSDPLTLGVLYNGNVTNTDEMSDVMYVPPPCEDNPDVADGRIIKTSPPVLLDMMLRADAEFGEAISTMNIETSRIRQDNYNDALQRYCKAVYEITAASMSRATSRMVLNFHDKNDNLLLPGNTCSFDVDNSQLFYGYITNIVHHGAVSGGCSTTVQMSYVRPTENYTIKNQSAIQYGSKNAAYA